MIGFSREKAKTADQGAELASPQFRVSCALSREVMAADHPPTVSLSGRLLETDGDSDDEDFDPVKLLDDDAASSSAGSDDDGSDGSGEDDDESDDDERARAVKASFLRSFGEHADTSDGTADPAPMLPDDDDDDVNLPLEDAEMDDLFDTDQSDTDEDDSDDEDEDVSLVPEDSNILNGSTGLVPGSEYSPSASGVSAVNKRTSAKEASPSVGAPIPRELFLYSPSLKRRARDTEALEVEVQAKRTKADSQSPTTRFGAKRALRFNPVELSSVKEGVRGGVAGDAFDDPPDEIEAQAMKLLGSLDDSGGESENVGGVARRTRAHLDLADIDLDYIESMMPLPDEGDMAFQFHDDDDEYANFLSALDFDIGAEVGGEDVGGDAGGGERAGRHIATLRHSDDDESDDDDYANVDPKAARVERRARRDLWIHGAATDLPSPQTRNTERTKTAYKYKSKLDRPEYRERPVWSTVVTRNARLRAEAAKAAAAGNANAANGAAISAVTRQPIVAHFTPQQTGTLHKMINDHVQLLLQTFARGAWDRDPGANGAARHACALLTQMLEEVKGRLIAKNTTKDPPHSSICFARPTGYDTKKWWLPARPGNIAVYTVLDCIPLRMASKFVNDVKQVGLVHRVPPGVKVSLPPMPPIMLPVPSASGPPSMAIQAGWDARMAEAEQRRSALEKQYGRLSELFRLENSGPTENTYLDEFQNTGDNEGATKSSEKDKSSKKPRARRKPPPDDMIPFCVRLPIGVVKASRGFAHWVNPDVLPRTPNLRITHTDDRWLPSEDALLAVGIENYGIQWEAIRRNLLPAKTLRQIINRQKNLCNEVRFKGDNVVKDAKQKVLQPLSSQEIEAIRTVLHKSKSFAGRENWSDVQKSCLPGRHASCLDRLWREAHPQGISAETYPEPGVALGAAKVATGKRYPGKGTPGGAPLAAIDMVNAAFHDNNVSIHMPRKAKIRNAGGVEVDDAPLQSLLFGDVSVGDVGGATTGTRRKQNAPSAVPARRVSPRKPQYAPTGMSSLLFGRLEDSRDVDASLGFGVTGVHSMDHLPASPVANAITNVAKSPTQREMARVLFGSPSQVPEALRSPPSAKKTRRRRSGSAKDHTPSRGVRFDKEDLDDSDSEDDEDVSRGAWVGSKLFEKKGGRGRPTRAVKYAEKALADRAARVAPDKEELPSSDDESMDSLGAEKEDIESSEDERDDAERSDLLDSYDDEGEGEIRETRGGVGTVGAIGAPQMAPNSFLFGSLESTMPLPDDPNLFRDEPVTTPENANTEEHVWTKAQDQAVLFAAQAKGISKATWQSLRSPRSACHGASIPQIERRFKWLCNRAQKQKCATKPSRGGGGKPPKELTTRSEREDKRR